MILYICIIWIDTYFPSFLSVLLPELKPMDLLNVLFSMSMFYATLLLMKETILQQNKCAMDSYPWNLLVLPCITLHIGSWSERREVVSFRVDCSTSWEEACWKPDVEYTFNK